MDIYYGNCDNDIGLQTNEDFNEMKSLVQNLQAENSRLKDELRRENISHNYHCKESQRKNDVIDDLQRKLDFVEKSYSDFKLVCDAESDRDGAIIKSLQRKLDRAVSDLYFVIENSGLSADYNVRARQTLKELKEQPSDG